MYSAAMRTLRVLWLCALAGGIPLAWLGVAAFTVELARLVYGRADAMRLTVELASLALLALQIWLLRRALDAPGELWGPVRHGLDFLAWRGLHPAVKAAAAGVLVLPLAWFLRADAWVFVDFAGMGMKALRMSDVQAFFDSIGVEVQHSIVGGLPLLFLYHTTARVFPARPRLLWMLLPLFFLGFAVVFIITVTIAHFWN